MGLNKYEPASEQIHIYVKAQGPSRTCAKKEKKKMLWLSNKLEGWFNLREEPPSSRSGSAASSAADGGEAGELICKRDHYTPAMWASVL